MWSIKPTGAVVAGVVLGLMGLAWMSRMLAESSTWLEHMMVALLLAAAAFVLGIPAEIMVRIQSHPPRSRGRHFGSAILASILWNAGPLIVWMLTYRYWAGVVSVI